MKDAARCPCLSGLTYVECCGAFYRGAAIAPTAGSLMRSRFTAFVTGNVDYLVATWDATTRPAAIEPDPSIRWTRLDILATTAGGPFDTVGTVEFAAHYRSDAGRGMQHEVSRFERRAGRWWYLDGVAG